MNDFYLHHTACPRCGSSDAKAVYKSGSAYCFSCRFYFPSTTTPYAVEETPTTKDLSLPDDCSFDYSPTCLQWVNQYGLSTAELIQRNVLWSEYRKQLIFSWKDAEGNVLLWQARNFSPGAKTKYFTRGNPEDVLPIYSTGEQSEQVVLVEDCISAIKIARYCDAMPVLGSDLSRTKLSRLRAYYGPSTAIVVWLDGNMYPKAQRIARRLQLLGMDARAAWTEYDPKCYSDEEILEKVLDRQPGM